MNGYSPWTPSQRLSTRTEVIESLLDPVRASGRIPGHAYRKWQGPHWTLYCLAVADAGPTDPLGMLDQVHQWLFSRAHLRPPSTTALPGQPRRVRRCASQEGAAVWYSLRLGLADERTDELVARLCDLQWPDGGWNCDRRPEARVSSVQETLIPLRGLAAYAASGRAHAGDARCAADRAAEFLLARRLLWRRRDGAAIRTEWGPDPMLIGVPISFYDVLSALLVMAEMGRIGDPRTADALDVLLAKRTEGGGFPAESRIVRTSTTIVSRGTFADWGPFGRRRANPWATDMAEFVLRSAGREPPG